MFHPVATDKLPERDEPGEECYHGKEHEGQGHALRGLVRGVFVRAFFTPEDVVIEAEHIECRQGRDEAHHDTEYRAEHERGGQISSLLKNPEKGEYLK